MHPHPHIHIHIHIQTNALTKSEPIGVCTFDMTVHVYLWFENVLFFSICQNHHLFVDRIWPVFQQKNYLKIVFWLFDVFETSFVLPNYFESNHFAYDFGMILAEKYYQTVTKCNLWVFDTRTTKNIFLLVVLLWHIEIFFLNESYLMIDFTDQAGEDSWKFNLFFLFRFLEIVFLSLSSLLWNCSRKCCRCQSGVFSSFQISGKVEKKTSHHSTVSAKPSYCFWGWFCSLLRQATFLGLAMSLEKNGLILKPIHNPS